MTNEEKDEVYALYRDAYEENSEIKEQKEIKSQSAYKPIINVEMCVNCEEDHPQMNHNESKYLDIFESLKNRLQPLGFLVILNATSIPGSKADLGVVDFLNPLTNKNEKRIYDKKMGIY